MQDPLASLNQQQRNGFQVAPMIAFLRKRKWLILGITVFGGLATGFVASKQQPTYEATASIILDLSVPQYLGANFREVVEAQPSWWQSNESMGPEFRVLRSVSQALAVAKGLCERQFDGKPALHVLIPSIRCQDPGDLARAAPVIKESLRVEPIKDTRVVELIVRSTSPKFAALFANTVAQVYTSENLQRRLSHSAGASTWLGDEYHQLLRELKTAEQGLIDFKQKHNIVAVGLEDDRNEISSRRKTIGMELNAAEVKLLGLAAEKEQFATFGKNDPLTEMNPGIAKSEVAQRLKQLYIDEYGKLIALQSKYLDKHPAVAEQEQRIKLIRNDLVREVELSRENFDAQYNTITKQVADLRAALNQATRDAIKLEGKSSEYFRLKRDLDRLNGLADQVGGRERETSLASNLKTNNVRQLDAAIVPELPVSPNIPQAVALAVALGLLLSIGLGVLLDSLDSTVKTQEDIEQVAGLTFLGLIPSIDQVEARNPNAYGKRKGRSKGPENGDGNGAGVNPQELFVFTHPTSQVAECCRAIRTNLLFMSPDKPARTLLITSAGPQEGKTTVVASMGITMATSGLRVLLVDTDMRRPRVHKAFGMASGGEGLSSAILGKGNVGSFIRGTKVPNLFLLACGACPPNPAELLHSERFKMIVDELVRTHDLVIFDSPPLGAVTDASILARMTEASLLVAKAGRTSKYALQRARRQLGADPHVNVLGCVLNDISLSHQREYGYYSYYYSRYGYYGKDEGTPSTSATV
jgi:succinoglycan biosynthesis transport protein ExoP